MPMSPKSAVTLLGADEILARTELPYEDVWVPQWEGTVRVRCLTGAERDEMEAAVTIFDAHGREGRDLTLVRAKLVAKCCVDAEGKRLFTDQQAGALGELNAAPIELLFDVAQRLSGLTPVVVQEMVEDFGGAQDGRSSSPSPDSSAAQ